MKEKSSKKNTVFSFERAEDSSGFLLWQVTSLWQRNLNKLLKNYDLTHAQFVALASASWLGLNSEAVTQIQIADHAKMDVMLTSNILKTLELKNLIKRSASKIDTRAKIVELTSKGIKLVGIAVKEVEAFDKQFFSRLGKEIGHFNIQLIKLTREE